MIAGRSSLKWKKLCLTAFGAVIIFGKQPLKNKGLLRQSRHDHVLTIEIVPWIRGSSRSKIKEFLL